MSQCLKLVNGGFVDKVIVFDSLPERLWKHVNTRAADGFPRSWARWLASIGSVRPVWKTETTVDLARNYTFKKTAIGEEPCFFVLDYQDINADKETWRNISTRRVCPMPANMALALAANPTRPLEVEPEDVPVVKVPSEVKEEEHPLVKPGETIIIQETAPKKRGRPRKVPVEA